MYIFFFLVVAYFIAVLKTTNGQVVAETFPWGQLTTTGTKPSARGGHSSVFQTVLPDAAEHHLRQADAPPLIHVPHPVDQQLPRREPGCAGLSSTATVVYLLLPSVGGTSLRRPAVALACRMISPRKSLLSGARSMEASVAASPSTPQAKTPNQVRPHRAQWHFVQNR